VQLTLSHGGLNQSMLSFVNLEKNFKCCHEYESTQVVFYLHYSVHLYLLPCNATWILEYIIFVHMCFLDGLVQFNR